MNALIDTVFSRGRAVIVLLVLILGLGIVAYMRIAKESAPDVPIPLIYVTVNYVGISPEDSERLLLRPLETELQSLEGLKETRGTAAQGFANIALEFTAGFDVDRALDDVRNAVDRARPKLPSEADEPIVQEVNVALFPILTAVLSGPVPERTLIELARKVRDRVEAVQGVLEADVGGTREEVLEVLVEPATLAAYNISLATLPTELQRNNQLITAGALDTGAGRFSIKVPGVIEEAFDVSSIPIKTQNGAVVTIGDVAVVRRTFRDPEEFARIDGLPAIALDIGKRIGANIIETVEDVRSAIGGMKAEWPSSVKVTYLQDQSKQIRTILYDLQNNVVAAILLVMIVVVATLGWRNAILVGVAVPGSFFAGIIALWAIGYTLNIVVLFSLILALGMLVDGAIITTELAQVRRSKLIPTLAGLGRRLAYIALLRFRGVLGNALRGDDQWIDLSHGRSP